MSNHPPSLIILAGPNGAGKSTAAPQYYAASWPLTSLSMRT